MSSPGIPVPISSPEELLERKKRVREVRRAALFEVERLASTQADLGKELRFELDALQRQGHKLEEIESTESGLLDALIRRITGRRLVLERRSATEALVRRYEAVSTRLRRAAVFTDELRLTSLQLHEEVQALHRERDATQASVERAARQVIEIEVQIRAHEAGERCAVTLDDLQFEHRYQSQAMQVGRAGVSLLSSEIPTAQQLRSTVQNLHEEMQHFVLSATQIVDGAGRKIQALGAAADAPIVVAELQESLTELGEAMRATELYLEHIGDLVAHKLPDLTARLQAEAEAGNSGVQADLEHLDRARAQAVAERALREAAVREVEALGRGGR